MFGPVLLRVVEGLDDAVAEHVERQASQILERVHDRTDQVVVQLNLRQDLKWHRVK